MPAKPKNHKENDIKNNTSDHRIQIFDTTLRDGQQCPGAGLSFEDNITYARLASELRVDVLEAGFPSASKLDFSIVKTIAESTSDLAYQPIIAGLCQLREEQVICTIEALAPVIAAKKGRVHIYVAVDPDLMPISLGKLASHKEQIINDVFRFTEMAVDAGCSVELSMEGYSRVHENFDFATELIRAAVQSGAQVINCPDTIGGACPVQGKDYFVETMKHHAAIIQKEFPNKNVIWSTHCHNDFGLAVQNSMNAVIHGPARQIEGCINGIGERAGNASLEQCIMLIKEFGAVADPKQPFYTTVDFSKLQTVSDFVSEHMLPRQPHWPITGDNAARHSSGGHTNAVLKNPLAYQPFDPKIIGKKVDFSFGPFSGSNHAQSIIESFGYICRDKEKSAIAQFIKDFYAERRKGITEEELMRAYFQFRAPIKIEKIEYLENGSASTIKLHGQFFDNQGITEKRCDESTLAAIKDLIETKFVPFKILHEETRLEEVLDKNGHVSRISIVDKESYQYEGIGKDADKKIAAVRALISAVNQAYISSRFFKSGQNIGRSIEQIC